MHMSQSPPCSKEMGEVGAEVPLPLRLPRGLPQLPCCTHAEDSRWGPAVLVGARGYDHGVTVLCGDPTHHTHSVNSSLRWALFITSSGINSSEKLNVTKVTQQVEDKVPFL
jgi:hypothetical protein